MSHAAQVFILWLALAFVGFIVWMVRRRRMRPKYSLLWLLTGCMMMLVALAPSLLRSVSRGLDVAYPPTLVFVVVIVFMLVLNVHFSWELSKLEERTRRLAEELALVHAPPAPGEGPGEIDGASARATD